MYFSGECVAINFWRTMRIWQPADGSYWTIESFGLKSGLLVNSLSFVTEDGE